MILLAVLLAEAVASSGGGGSIAVQIHNVRNAHGHVRVDICPRARFLADGCPWHADAPARSGTTTVTVTGVPPGEYAVQAFHDENSNNRIDRALFGIPREGVGFSRDARIVLGPPSWRDAQFTHGSAAQVISFSLRYFIGPGSAEEWQRKHPER